MKTLDHALLDAADDVRQRVATAPTRPVAQLRHRRRRRTALAGAAVALLVIAIPGTLILAQRSSSRLPAGAVRINPGDLPTEELITVAGDRPGDELYLIPTGEHSVFLRVRAQEPTLMFGTSCDVVSATPLPVGWEGICLEYTSNGQRVTGRFPYGTTSDGSDTASTDNSSDGPVDIPGGPLSTSLRESVAHIPALAALTIEGSTDQSEAGAQWGMVGLVADDGSRIEIITQEAPAGLLDLLELQSDTTRQIGPNGEDLVLRDNGTTLQVVAIGLDGTMLNLIIEPINRVAPGNPSALAQVDLDQAREWTLLLLHLITA